eukprot:3939580-Pyramimonas_sp.AAC.1
MVEEVSGGGSVGEHGCTSIVLRGGGQSHRADSCQNAAQERDTMTQNITLSVAALPRGDCEGVEVCVTDRSCDHHFSTCC